MLSAIFFSFFIKKKKKIPYHYWFASDAFAKMKTHNLPHHYSINKILRAISFLFFNLPYHYSTHKILSGFLNEKKKKKKVKKLKAMF